MTTNLSRRRFLGTSAAAAGTSRRRLPHSVCRRSAAQGASAAAPGAATPEINAWVVVKPDDTVVIRIARSEMGQGSLTGLAQLVAEELDCNWSKVTTEYPTPGQNLARNRVWGNFSTGGSRGIRDSHEYVRKGGATARMMLVQAAADSWKVPAAECVGGQQRDHAYAFGTQHDVRQGRRRGGESRRRRPTCRSRTRRTGSSPASGWRGWTRPTRSRARRSTGWT